MAKAPSSSMFEVNCPAQTYDWGKIGGDSMVYRFAKDGNNATTDSSKPYAELWMGTHPSGPGKTVDGTLLSQLVHNDPEHYIGKDVVAKFGPDLPFLFKILAVRKALSIQAHPDKQLAKRLFKESPENYKDDNHKPEMAVALTPFSAFCGFRPLNEIADFAKEIPELRALVTPEEADAFANTINDTSATDEQKKQALKRFFSVLMRADPEKTKTQVDALVKRVSDPSNSLPDAKYADLIKNLNKDYPGDIGIFCVYTLNICSLEPGQAIFLKANEPHAYLSGDIVECMAASDNVVRAGLTPKFRDVDTLTDMLTYKSASIQDQILPPQKFLNTKHSILYDPPIDEFSVVLTKLDDGASESMPPLDGPSILIVTKLSPDSTVLLNYTGPLGNGSLTASKEGQVYYIVPGTSLDMKASGDAILYRAYVVA